MVEQQKTPSGMWTLAFVCAALSMAFWMAAVSSVLPSPAALKSRTSMTAGTSAAAAGAWVVVARNPLRVTSGFMIFIPSCEESPC